MQFTNSVHRILKLQKNVWLMIKVENGGILIHPF